METKKTIIDNRFKLLNKLGESKSSEIYKALDLTSNTQVALKFETIQNRQQFPVEIQALTNLSTIKGIPKLLATGAFNNKQYLVMQLLDSNLESKFKKYNNKFSLNCVTSIGLQMIELLKNLHDMNYIHRDIKPANIMTGKKSKGENLLLYLIDFGISKKYRDPITKQHSLYAEKRSIIGSITYSSLNAHLGIEQSRRDDLEACMNVLVYFLKGKLPWECSEQEISNYFIVGIMKKATIEQICKDCPSEFVEMLKYLRSLHFQDRPNYDYLLEIINRIHTNSNFSLHFDWTHKTKKTGNDDFLAVGLDNKSNPRRASAQIILTDINGLTKKQNKKKSRKVKSNKESDESNEISCDSDSPCPSPVRLKLSKNEEESKNLAEYRIVVNGDMHAGMNTRNEDREEDEDDIQALCRKDTIKDTKYPEFNDRKHAGKPN
ncbi:hypothetical protein SteCoe_25483 [Stentor coeruleus]|uniref:Casein kinase I n=1 Tax=Stentor coeruleus TaxID=5963 RepID=A0A1R2BF53_9CILI|nr:hypothetical protein SteCoe_25483 [Stentor coeruleus]